jgi:hypothetical protein
MKDVILSSLKTSLYPENIRRNQKWNIPVRRGKIYSSFSRYCTGPGQLPVTILHIIIPFD